MTLHEAFERECNRQKNNNIVITNEMINTFNNLNEYFCDLSYQSCAVEITKNKEIGLNLTFIRDKTLLITKSFEPNKVEGFGDRILYSLFYDKKHMISDTTNLKEFAQKFKNYIQS